MEEIYLVYADAVNNNNKFWSAKVDGNKLTVQWGRVGYSPQTKEHSCKSVSAAKYKFHELINQKESKGYSRSTPQIDGDDSPKINRALHLLEIIHEHIKIQSFGDEYINKLNEYLKLIPTPLGMKINPRNVYRTTGDVERQKTILSSLLAAAIKAKVPPSLKAIGADFWNCID